jgi:hypothetical protein
MPQSADKTFSCLKLEPNYIKHGLVYQFVRFITFTIFYNFIYHKDMEVDVIGWSFEAVSVFVQGQPVLFGNK